MEFKFVLSRHAQFTHNVQKTQAKTSAKTKTDQEHYQNTEKYKKIKYDPKLIDAKDIDVNQVFQSRPMFAMQQISIVITSPLNRCLQTAKILTEGLEHIQVIVQPLLTARVSSAWSIGSSIQQKISDYPKFNFDFAHKQQKNWYLDLLDEKIKSKYDKNDYSPESILQFISEGYSQLQESIQNRVRKLKDKIKKIYLQKSGNKRILILSHSSILQAFMASEINKKGRAISPIQFNHSFPIYISYDYFMNRTILGSQQQKNLKTQIKENQIQK